MKKKTKIILIIVIVLAFLLIGGFIFIKYNDSIKEKSAYNDLKKSLKIKNKTYEYGEEVDLSSLKIPKNSKIYYNNKLVKNKIKLDKLGNNNLRVTSYKIYKNTLGKKKKVTYKKWVIYKVEDKTPPEITSSDKTLTVGNSINLLDGVSANDNVDGNIEVKAEGNVDTSKAGSYKVKYSAIDKSGNKAEKENTITVNEKVEAIIPSSSRSSNNRSINQKNNSNNRGASNNASSNNSSSSNNSDGTYVNMRSILDMVNEERRKNNVQNLTWDNSLEEFAKIRAKEQVIKFGHDRPDGSSFRSLSPKLLGENAAIIPSRMSISELNGWWITSPGHHQNMIMSYYKIFGSSCYQSNGRQYCIELFG